ncbi:MAG: inositol monophosphatase family protein [Gemmatales bacterium]
MNPTVRERYLRAIDAASDAGKLALGYFDNNVAVEWKENDTPVTVADRKAEELLRSRLLGLFPHDGFLGEESGSVKGSSGFRWIIDPIDGTRSFVRGIPLWGTLIGLEYDGKPVVGVCRLPAFGKEGQTFHAMQGNGAFRDQTRIHVSEVKSLEESQVFYSSLAWFMASGVKEAFLEITQRSQRQRGFGDFYGFMLVAQGSGELMIEYGVSPWDVAALAPIVEEAGGQFTDWDGNRTIFRPDILASNGVQHAATLELLRTRRTADFKPDDVKHRQYIT